MEKWTMWFKCKFCSRAFEFQRALEDHRDTSACRFHYDKFFKERDEALRARIAEEQAVRMASSSNPEPAISANPGSNTQSNNSSPTSNPPQSPVTVKQEIKEEPESEESARNSEAEEDREGAGGPERSSQYKCFGCKLCFGAERLYQAHLRESDCGAEYLRILGERPDPPNLINIKEEVDLGVDDGSEMNLYEEPE